MHILIMPLAYLGRLVDDTDEDDVFEKVWVGFNKGKSVELCRNKAPATLQMPQAIYAKFLVAFRNALRLASDDSQHALPLAITVHGGVVANGPYVEEPQIVRADASFRRGAGWFDWVQVLLGNPAIPHEGASVKRKHQLLAPDGTTRIVYHLDLN